MKQIWTPRTDITPLELAWAAGLFEGEGCIRINPPANHNYGHIEASVSNTDMDILNFFQSRWPSSRLKKVSVRPDQRDAYCWALQARRALVFLEMIAPYVICQRNKDRIWTACEFQALKSLRRGERPIDYAEQGF